MNVLLESINVPPTVPRIMSWHMMIVNWGDRKAPEYSFTREQDPPRGWFTEDMRWEYSTYFSPHCRAYNVNKFTSPEIRRLFDIGKPPSLLKCHANLLFLSFPAQREGMSLGLPDQMDIDTIVAKGRRGQRAMPICLSVCL